MDATASAGGIGDSAELNVAGNASFTSADTTNVILDTAANTFGGTLSFTASTGSLNDVTIVDDSALALPALSIGGNLVASGAGLTQSGTITVTGTSDVTSTGATNDISLTNGSNDFGSALTVTTDAAAGSDAVIVSSAGVALGASSVGGLFDLTATGINVTGWQELAR